MKAAAPLMVILALAAPGAAAAQDVPRIDVGPDEILLSVRP